MKSLILYDADPDGCLAAVIIGRHAASQGEVVYERAIRYEDPPFELVDKNTNVIITDFNYSREITAKLCELSHAVLVLDHHKTALEELEGLDDEWNNLVLIIDSSKSSCWHAWQYVHGDDPHFLVDYVDDMDRWQWKQPHSEAINAYLDTTPSTIEAWSALLENVTLGDAQDRGFAVKAYKDKTINILEKQAVLMEIGGHKVRAVNCADPALVSYLGNKLAQDAPFGATFYLQPNGRWKFSIRSITNDTNPEGIDVSEIAGLFGGGGHENAAGFKVNTLFPFELVKDSVVTR